jgi:hypothetical protein
VDVVASDNSASIPRAGSPEDRAAPLGERRREATTVTEIARGRLLAAPDHPVLRREGGLLLAAKRTRLDLDAALSGDIDGFGHRLANKMVDRWERQGQADPLLALLRSASSRPAALEALGEFLEREATAPVARALIAWGVPEADAIDKANAVQAFVIGTVVTRRMLQTGAVAAATSAQLRGWLAVVLQRLIDDGAPGGYLPRSAGRERRANPASDSDAKGTGS